MGHAMNDESGAHASMLRCADGSYYVGSARLGLERRLSEHNNGTYGGYTSKRLPVERQIKGWSRAKKEALVRGDFGLIRQLSKRRD
jgi:putative endonuclease